MQLPQWRMQVLLLALACSAQYVLAQMPPMEPLQPFKPLAPLPPLRPFPGFAPFPAMQQMPPMQMPQMQMPSFPNFPTMQPFQGPAGGPGTYSASSSSSSFAGPRASTTPGCTVVQETSGESQGSTGSGSTSCRLSQRVEVCHSAAQGSKGHTRAVATINGKEATCCVVLLKLPAKTQQLFCASPAKSVNYSRMPAANTAVELKPTCSSSKPGGSAGSLSCTGRRHVLRWHGVHGSLFAWKRV